jgi:hypothetical protein
LLVSVQSQSFVPPSDQHQTTLRERALEPAWRDEAKQLVSTMESGQRPWYWKDPRLAVTLGFWQQFWDEPIYVITVRDPLDTASSLRKIYKMPLTAGHLLWQRYVTSALRHTATAAHRIFVQYECLLSAPVEQCRRLGDFLERHCGLQSAPAGSQQLDAMLAVVSPNLRTNASKSSFLAAPEASQAQKSLYRYLQSMAKDQPASLDPEAFEIFPGWRDYLEALTTVDKLRDALVREQQTFAARVQRKLIRKPQVDELPW